MNTFLCFIHQFKMAAINGRKPIIVCIPLGPKKIIKSSLSCTVFATNAFFAFYAEIQDGHKNGGKTIFGKKCQMTILHSFLDKCISAFKTEIQDGQQKWTENNFFAKSVR